MTETQVLDYFLSLSDEEKKLLVEKLAKHINSKVVDSDYLDMLEDTTLKT